MSQAIVQSSLFRQIVLGGILGEVLIDCVHQRGPVDLAAHLPFGDSGDKFKKRDAAVRFDEKQVPRHLPFCMGKAAQESLSQPPRPIGQIIIFGAGHGEALLALLCFQPIQAVGNDLMPGGAAPWGVKRDGVAAKIVRVHLRAGGGNAADGFTLRQWKVVQNLIAVKLVADDISSIAGFIFQVQQQAGMIRDSFPVPLCLSRDVSRIA